jgi:hypothetical protein
MNTKKFYFLISGFLCLWLSGEAQVFPNLGGQRIGISALTFLKNDLSPRSIALGGASIALRGDPYAMHVNPAAGVDNPYNQLAISTRTLPAGIFQSFAGALFPRANKTVWMVSMNYLGSGSQKRRTEFQPFGDGTFYTSDAFKLGFGYSKALSKMFSFGLNANYIREQLATYSAQAVAVDLGFLYKTDWKRLSFAVGLQHFGGNSTLSGSDLPVMYNRTGGVNKEAYGAPTLFSMGASMVPYAEGIHEILVSAQLNHPNDNAENIRLGLEYTVDSMFFARVGLRVNVPGEHVSAGVGFRRYLGYVPFSVEYAVLPNDYLGWMHTIGLSIGLKTKIK